MNIPNYIIFWYSLKLIKLEEASTHKSAKTHAEMFLWPVTLTFRHQNKWVSRTLWNISIFYVKFDDSSCIGFWYVVRKTVRLSQTEVKKPYLCDCRLRGQRNLSDPQKTWENNNLRLHFSMNVRMREIKPYRSCRMIYLTTVAIVIRRPLYSRPYR